MGDNTVALFLNDRCWDIKRNPEKYVKRLVIAMSSGIRDDAGGGMQVLPSQHADTLQIVRAGANSISSFGFAHWRDSDEQVLRAMADAQGYRLVKKRPRP